VKKEARLRKKVMNPVKAMLIERSIRKERRRKRNTRRKGKSKREVIVRKRETIHPLK